MTTDLAGPHQKTLGTDNNCNTKGFVAERRRIGVMPPMAQNTDHSDGSASDGRSGEAIKPQLIPYRQAKNAEIALFAD